MNVPWMFHECSMNVPWIMTCSILLASIFADLWLCESRIWDKCIDPDSAIMRYVHVQMLLTLHDVTLKMRWCTRWDHPFHVFLLKFWLSISDNTSTHPDIFPTGNPPDFRGICWFPRQERISWWTPCATDIRILDVGFSALKLVDCLIFYIWVCLKMGDLLLTPPFGCV